MKNGFLLPLLITLFCQCTNKQEKNHDAKSEKYSLSQDTTVVSVSADLYYNTGRFNEAIIEYDRLLGIDSTNGKYLFRNAYCLTQLDRPIEAIHFYNRAAELGYREFDCFYSVGLNALILKDDSLAILYFKKCLSIKPNSKEALTFLDHLKGASKSVSL